MFKFRPLGRYIAVLQNAWAGGIAQAASVIVNLLVVRLSLEYLGPSDFGAWMAINSFIAILILTDLGLSSAMLRLAALGRSQDGTYDVYNLTITAARFLCIPALIILPVVIATTSVPQIQIILGIHEPSRGHVVLNTIWLLTAVFSINLVVQVATPIRLGMQAGHINGLYQTAGHVGNLLGVIAAIHFTAPLAILAAAAVAGTAGANVVNFASLLIATRRHRSSQANAPRILSILRPSLPFFVLVTIGILSYNLDNLVIATFLSVDQVSQNAVAQRLFNVPISVVSLFFVGLWAAYADAERTQDYTWIKKAYTRALSISFIFAVMATIILYFLFPLLAELLTGGVVKFDHWLVISFALWVPVTALSGATASLMNGLHIVRWQIYFAILALVINLVASIILVEEIGVSGPIMGTLISMCLVQPLMIVKSFHEIRKRQLFTNNEAST